MGIGAHMRLQVAGEP